MNACAQCGLEIDSTDRFCTHCGTPASSNEQERANPALAAAAGSIQASQIGAAVWAVLAIIIVATSSEPGTWFLILLPSLIGAVWPLARNDGLSAKVDQLRARLTAAADRNRQRTGKLARFVVRPFCGGGLFLFAITERITDVHLRAGVRAASFLYFAVAFALLIAAAAYAIVMVIVVIVLILITGWILGRVLGGESSGTTVRTTTRWTTDWLSRPKQEHFRGGRKIGETRHTADWLGNPVAEHFTGGEKTGTSRPDTDWLGNPRTVHRDLEGNKVGESRPDTDILGRPVTEHFDAEGNKTGESRPDTDLLGRPVVRHEMKDPVNEGQE